MKLFTIIFISLNRIPMSSIHTPQTKKPDICCVALQRILFNSQWKVCYVWVTTNQKISHQSSRVHPVFESNNFSCSAAARPIWPLVSQTVKPHDSTKMWQITTGLFSLMLSDTTIIELNLSQTHLFNEGAICKIQNLKVPPQIRRSNDQSLPSLDSLLESSWTM